MKLSVALRGNLKRYVAQEIRDAETAVTMAAKDVADGLKRDLRIDVRTAGLGARLANTWRSKSYPRSGKSMKAAAFVWSKAPAIIRGHEGTTIKSADGFFLAIPTPAAPKKGMGGKRISPSTFPEGRFGPLRFVYRRRGPSSSGGR